MMFQVLKHFGIEDAKSFWATKNEGRSVDGVIGPSLLDLIGHMGKGNQRIIIDYDVDYPVLIYRVIKAGDSR
jgi:hypothetical protein